VTGSIGPGLAGQGQFSAVARFRVGGRRVVCRTGRVDWAASDPA